MAHYRQTGKAIDKFYEQAAGADKNIATQKTVGEPAGKGCSGVEMGKIGNASRPCISTACNENQESARVAETPPITGRDSNLVSKVP